METTEQATRRAAADELERKLIALEDEPAADVLPGIVASSDQLAAMLEGEA